MGKTLSLLLLLVNQWCYSQTENYSSEESLRQEILQMDSLLFDVAFNQCDLEVYKTIIKDGLEFYDDRTGLNTDVEKEYASFQDKCSRPFIETEVSKLGNYGAVQTGRHTFYNDLVAVQTAKFITIWEKTENGWIVKRAVSYGHNDL